MSSYRQVRPDRQGFGSGVGTERAVIGFVQQGLSAEEAARRLAEEGRNVLPVPPRPPVWRHLVHQFVEFFALMLWVAAGLAFVAGLPQLGVAIVIVVLLNGVFAFVQEYRAERAAAALADLLPRRATVLRDGVPAQVDAADLVRGDLVLLDAGDRISADLVVVEAYGLELDTSTMTGESMPVTVGVGDVAHAGTFVVEGEARAVVDRTGSSTRLAGLASMTGAGRRPLSPLTRELHHLVRVIATIAVSIGLAFFALSMVIGTSLDQGLVFAIGVTVALVPSAMLPTVTLSLALGAERLARRHALVRRLESVETLGSVTFICTDKTGTLTTNQMSVVEVWMPGGSATIRGAGYGPMAEIVSDHAPGALEGLALVAARCSTGAVVEVEGRWEPRGDTMEAALMALAMRVGIDVDDDRARRADVTRFPFDPRRRRMSVTVAGELLVKGAPDSVLPRCTRGAEGAQEVLDRLTGRGLRVLAIARRPVGDVVPTDADEVETDLELVGLVGLEDPPREGVGQAVAACRRAGIQVAMITGDHPATARTIAAEIGLLGAEELVVEGADLPDDDEQLGALVDRDGIVLSRIDPEHKLRIARVLQARGHVVAMTGDGVNDGPALQQADIGIAMGTTGTDVAREASDLVLLEEDFAVIVAAVEQGRSTFANIRRFLTYHLTDNVAELAPFVVWAMSGGRFPLIIGVLQVLGLDIGTDTLPAVALGAEHPGPDVLDRPPARGHLLNRRVAWRAFGVLGPTEVVMSFLAFGTTCVAAGWRWGDGAPGGSLQLSASGAAFAAIVIAQLTNAFLCRSSTLPIAAIGWTSNRFLLGAVGAEILITGSFLFVPVIAEAMDQAPPTSWGWLVAVCASPVMVLVDSVEKGVQRRRRRGRGSERLALRAGGRNTV